MKTLFKTLFEYNHYSNKQLVQSFIANQSAVSSESVKLFSHILNAHEIWNSRILGKTCDYGVWDVQLLTNFERLIQIRRENTMTILENLSLDEVVQHPKARGKQISEVLFHVINHSTYHRGQIAMDFRKNGIEPIVTDYILFEK
jgi:uncharacterized damage-inducible protein DinB